MRELPQAGEQAAVWVADFVAESLERRDRGGRVGSDHCGDLTDAVFTPGGIEDVLPSGLGVGDPLDKI
ncbi:hypothetical protein [Micromonospora lutea]|uniref:hypothetical protein n=1 Tax=Micromonospora lutea TaxID=419825 RepID=UPI00194DB1B1|nr:hypothetical protein [Micromonospora lutea]